VILGGFFLSEKSLGGGGYIKIFVVKKQQCKRFPPTKKTHIGKNPPPKL